MEVYDRILLDVQRKTESTAMRWEIVPRSAYPGVISDTEDVRRAYRAPYALGRKSYDLLFIDKRARVEYGMGGRRETTSHRLLILDASQTPVIELYDGLIDRDELARLGGMIAELNDQAQEFFEAFEESGKY